MTELEFKFQVPAAAAPALRAELRRRGARALRLDARYFDTPDGRLAAHGLSLRLRREGRRFVQTLKAAGDMALRRHEHNVTVPAAGGAAPAVDVQRHAGSAAGKLLHEALDGQGGAAALIEVYRSEVSRLRCDVQVQGALIEAAFDNGTITAGERSAPIRELELELKSGEPSALVALGKAWAGHAGLWLDTVSKAERGALLARGEAFGAPVKAIAPRLRRGMSDQAALQAIVRGCVDQICANVGAVGAGSDAAEHIHQLRVGLRRMRTALRELAVLDAALDRRWEEPLAHAFRQLGEVRDEQAVAAAVRPLLASAGAPSVSWTPRVVPVDPAGVVRDSAFQCVLLDLVGYALRPAPAQASSAPHALRRHAAARLAKLHRQVTRAGRHFERLPAPEQHQARKQLKRLRYLAEFVATLFDKRAAARYLDRLEPAQDALGAHIDALMARDRFRREAEHDADALFAVGWLQAHLETTARACREYLKGVRAAPRFWRR